ncbi:mitochondrial ribosome-associated GTPase 1-like [Homarus americanus]|uniref:Mitochondrial GTPase 1 n=1 Tax=Homarus americanus TaxID=6706 RepID=A0A8J5N0G5_HOMAM|nr:mitochondrial ribosome-associated GTPase 1-like [Homarus americanus]XP_042220028.1 mitochondrial ribosome-associated GTPase 1-like [Homarus americanus]XP_042220029.1 mitochondrial ribosome-associated GTPase 1-like [Homarus americanus]KAG7169987.1 Mitochondrial ribosome-associated GTPase 1-like [Homarus americanus]
MAVPVVRHGLRMRKFFNIKNQDVAQWFPGHMAKGLNQMQRKLKSVDCIIEVHDARIPVSGRNSLFEKRLGLSSLKPHILILNKIDLADLRHRNKIESYYESQGVKNIIFANCKKPDSRGIKSIIPTVSELVQNAERFNRSEEKEYQMMVIGIPNVGKSSLINALRAKHTRKSKATQVGGLPGITRSVLERIKVCHHPKVYLLDTPGVLSPRIPDVETGLKLALVATIKDHLVGEDIMADYLLYRLNSQGNHSYVSYLGIDEPTDTIQQLLVSAAIKNNWMVKIRDHRGIQTVPNIMLSATKFIKGFRTGQFGTLLLDDTPLMLEKERNN